MTKLNCQQVEFVNNKYIVKMSIFSSFGLGPIVGGLTAGVVATNMCLNGLTSVCQSAISNAIYLTTSTNTTGTETISKLIITKDLEATLEKIYLFANEIKSNKESKILSKSLQDIYDIIKQIQETLNIAKQRKEYQDSIYFGNTRIRSYDYSDLYQKLQIQIEVMNTRFNYLVQMITVINNFHHVD